MEIVLCVIFIGIGLACLCYAFWLEFKRYKALIKRDEAQAAVNAKILQILEDQWSELPEV